MKAPALAAAALLALAALPSRAQPPEPRRPVPAAQWSEDTAHTLARALVAEADSSRDDHAAIAWVLAKRWPGYSEHAHPVTFARYVRLYTSLWKLPQTPRKAEIRGLPWGPSRAPHGRARWDATRAWVERWARGDVADPCPSARHWGGTGVDSFPAGARFFDCGHTRNRFYATVGGES